MLPGAPSEPDTAPDPPSLPNQTVLQAFEAREDLAPYGSNALLLFALELGHRVDDVHSVAAVALTDGPDDKKCDLVFVDRDASRAIIAQGYVAATPRPSAPANKASDLNTAAAWIVGLSGELPARLEDAALELADGLTSGEISQIEAWYVHNLPESANVQAELDRVASTTDALVRRDYPDHDVQVQAREIGLDTLERWYRATQAAIFVTDDFDLPLTGYAEETGDEWRALCTTVPGRWLADLHRRYGTDLFSANLRDYLGSRRSDRNINNNIKMTAQSEPQRFWPYNNGVTALVNSFRVSGDTLHVSGISIVNGAQTTGALDAALPDAKEDSAAAEPRVMMRFVHCSDAEIVREIVRFNNSQNRIEAADFRSNDSVQTRLRDEFAVIPDADYSGGRRGDEDDVIRRSRNRIPSGTAAQALASFHGDPETAYHDKSGIWVNDGLYGRVFGDHTTARHIVFCYSLLRSIEAYKKRLVEREGAQLAEHEVAQIEFLRQRGSIQLVLAALGTSIELILGRPVASKWVLSFGAGISPEVGAQYWGPIVEVSLAFADQLARAAGARGLKNRAQVDEALRDFRSMFQATRTANTSIYDALARRVQES